MIAAWALGACAAEPPRELRVLVKPLAQPADERQVARTVERTSGHSVVAVQANGGGWYRLILRCRDDADCTGALRALVADRVNFEAAQADELKHPNGEGPR